MVMFLADRTWNALSIHATRGGRVAFMSPVEDEPRRWRTAAAYITWCGLALIGVRTGLNSPFGTTTQVGLGASVLVVLIGVVHLWSRASPRRLAWRWPSLLAQTAFTLVAVSTLHPTMAVFLVVLVAPVREAGTGRQALAWLILSNSVLLVLLLGDTPSPTGVALWLLFVGFQLFAWTMSLSIESERAWREQLVGVNAELMATRYLLQETARTQERLRISRELHDVAGHRLTALRLNLQSVAEDAGPELDRVELCQALAGELLYDIRTVVHELRADDALNLRAALELLRRQHLELHVDVDVSDDVRVESVPIAEAVLRSSEEAITNAVKHGRAETVWIRLGQKNGRVLLVVQDDGRGGALRSGGEGLRGMRERAASLGGALHIQPSQSCGWRLEISLPAETPASKGSPRAEGGP